jgi:hypothetical protein
LLPTALIGASELSLVGASELAGFRWSVGIGACGLSGALTRSLWPSLQALLFIQEDQLSDAKEANRCRTHLPV